MTPVIYTGPPDPEHGGNWPDWMRVKPISERERQRLIRNGPPLPKIYATRETERGEPIHGAVVMLAAPDEFYHLHRAGRAVLHSSDDLAPWLAAGWRLTSY